MAPASDGTATVVRRAVGTAKRALEYAGAHARRPRLPPPGPRSPLLGQLQSWFSTHHHSPPPLEGESSMVFRRGDYGGTLRAERRGRRSMSRAAQQQIANT